VVRHDSHSRTFRKQRRFRRFVTEGLRRLKSGYRTGARHYTLSAGATIIRRTSGFGRTAAGVTLSPAQSEIAPQRLRQAGIAVAAAGSALWLTFRLALG